MRDHAVEKRTRPARSPAAATPLARTVKPLAIARWVEARRESLTDSWLGEIGSRDASSGKALGGLVEPFIRLFVSMLPATLGPLRDQVEPVWVQTAELFGSVASQRGLAAGEVIEEFQLLRERVIRSMFEDPPVDEEGQISLRDVLRLNRVIDLGVTHASVGHTDALFFSLFQGSGVPESPGEQLEREVAEQLDGLRREFAEVSGALQG